MIKNENEMEIGKERVSENDNEQITKLEIQELR